MPALTNSSVGSWAGMRDELLTIVWPRSSKNLRNRRRISLLFIKLFYFLSYGVLIISKTLQSPKKTAGIARLERGTQIPVVQFSFHRRVKRGPVALGENFFDQIRGYPTIEQLLPEYCQASLFPLRDVVFSKP